MIKTTYIQNLITELMARLPELEWKVSNLNPALFNRSLPKKIFKTQEPTALACINELKADLHVLKQVKHERSAEYLAEQLKQKVSILVGISRLEHKNKGKIQPASFSMEKICTRQQWLQSLEQEVTVLRKQKQALSTRLTQINPHKSDPAVLLNLKHELGLLEKKLTLAEEALNKACQK